MLQAIVFATLLGRVLTRSNDTVVEAANLTALPDDLGFEIRFELFNKEKIGESELLKTFGEIPKNRFYHGFNATKPLKLLIHGWMRGVKGPMVQEIKNAYLPEHDYNVVAVDWTKESFKFYTKARKKVPAVARVVAHFVRRLVEDYDIDVRNIHIIGHSLGANIAYVVGKELNSSVGRITGLDPAAPLFLGTPDRFNKSCAQFVDVVHTCDNLLSINGPIGHVDFFPNGGTAPQPGCILQDFLGGWCSHRRAYSLFAETILNPRAFPAIPCDNWKNYKKKKCTGEVAYMGEFVSKEIKGDYYLKTNKAYPFGQGEHEY